ncbi:MAG: hypothetical protein KBG46_12975 [Paracoccus sp.]|nr:hypothetical protein [Paracoccus sp. (in: a-proteobacteria)]
MKKPETDASENKATPEKDSKKKPVSGAVIDSHPISASEAAAAAKPEAKPLVESKLVGSGTGPDAAAPKAGARPDTGAPVKASASSVPPVAKSEAPKDVAKSEPAKSEPVKSDPAKSDPVKAASGSGPTSAPTPPASTPPAPPAAAPATKVETRVVEVRKAGFMPTFLGGVIAAGLGAGATYWAIPHLPAAWQPVVPVAADGQLEAARAAGTEAATAALQSQTEALATRAAEAGADAARQALADLQPPAGDAAAMSAQAEKLAALEKTVTDLAARPVVAPVVSGEGSERLQGVLNELTARLTAQQQRLDELAARPASDAGSAEQLQGFVAQAEALQKQIAASAAEAEQRIAAAESQASALQESAETANRRAQAATAAAALRAAIETGGSRDQALADLGAAGIEAPAVLNGDLPTLEQLRAEFPAAARAGLAAALNAAPNSGGALGVIGDFLRVQTGARSVEPREGDDPDAVLSRVDAAVKAGDIRGALTGITTLPEPAQAAMADWTSRAQLWVDADTALATLASGSL